MDKKESFQNFESFLFFSQENSKMNFYFANSSFTILVLIPLVTFFIPLYSRIAFACPLLFPVLQKTITEGFPLNSFNLLSTSSSGIFTAPFTLPSANSCGVLTSTKNAPFATCSLSESSYVTKVTIANFGFE